MHLIADGAMQRFGYVSMSQMIRKRGTELYFQINTTKPGIPTKTKQTRILPNTPLIPKTADCCLIRQPRQTSYISHLLDFASQSNHFFPEFLQFPVYFTAASADRRIFCQSDICHCQDHIFSHRTQTLRHKTHKSSPPGHYRRPGLNALDALCTCYSDFPHITPATNENTRNEHELHTTTRLRRTQTNDYERNVSRQEPSWH